MATYWRLSGVYFFYFAGVGAFIPFWGLYLDHVGFTPVEIGVLMGIQLGTKIVAPPLWGWLSDHSGHRVVILRVVTLLTAMIFAATLLAGTFLQMALVMALAGFFWNASLPVFETTTLTHLGDGAHRYSHIRLWGSWGFIVSVVGLALLLDRHGMAVLPWIVVFLLGLTWLNTLWLHEAPDGSGHAGAPSLIDVLRRPGVIALLAACFFLQASMGPYYAFFSLYLEQHGYTRTLVGPLWAIGVIAEIVVFVFMHRLLPRFGARKLLIFAMGLTALRWLLIATIPEVLPVLVFAQILHAASYGLYHAAAIHLIFRYFPGRLQARGQAFYNSIAFGLGNAAGSFLAGFVWDSLGPAWIYILGAVLAGIGAGITWWFVRER